MKRIIRLTESELTRIVKRVISESNTNIKIGSKIPRITNRLYIMGRGYRFIETMGDKRENEFEINNAVVSTKTPNGYIVKVSYLFFDPKNDRKTSEKSVYETLRDVCLRIDNKDIIEYSNNVLQVRWSNEFIKSRVTACSSNKTDVDYLKVFLTFDDVKKFQKWVINVKKDKKILGSTGVDSDWGPNTKLAWDKYGSEYVKTLNKTKTKDDCLSSAGFVKKTGVARNQVGKSMSFSGYEGTYQGKRTTLTTDGNVTIYEKRKNYLTNGKWKCDNGKFVIYDLVDTKLPPLPF